MNLNFSAARKNRSANAFVKITESENLMVLFLAQFITPRSIINLLPGTAPLKAANSYFISFQPKTRHKYPPVHIGFLNFKFNYISRIK